MNNLIKKDLDLDAKAQRAKSVPTVEWNGTHFDLDELTHFSREELLTIKAQIEQNLIQIKTQLGQAKVDLELDGIAPNPQWKHRAEIARMHKGRELQLINNALTLKKAKGLPDTSSLPKPKGKTPKDEFKTEDENLYIMQKQAEFGERFINCAQIVLTRETFRRILEMAREARLGE